VEATQKIVGTFAISYLDQLFYLDFWSLPQFGKPKLAHLLTLGKSGQQRQCIEEIARYAKQPLLKLIKTEKVDSIAFAPHSIPRKIAFLKYFKQLLELPLPEIEVVKASIGGVPVAQKSLSKLADRQKNARETLLIPSVAAGFRKTLVIDDAVGSGATINEIAKKLKDKGVKKVIGFAIVGSIKGFEVIQDV
jgi:predicted amidophosphoribosyltransferase